MNPVSIVIPTLNRPSLLERTILCFLQADASEFELIVVDQSEEINSAVVELAARLPQRLRYHHAPGRCGLPQARNVGISLAGNAVILFCDDDIVPSTGLVSAHARCYDEPNVGAVAGRVVAPSGTDGGNCLVGGKRGPPVGVPGLHKEPRRPSCHRVGRVSSITGNQVDCFDQVKPCEVDHGQGCNISFRKEAIEAVGGFDPRFGGGSFLEETDACLRVKKWGYRIVFEPAAEVIHLKEAGGGCRPRDPEEWYWWYGHNYVLLLLKDLGWYSWPGFLLCRLSTIVVGVWRTGSVRVLWRGLAGMAAGVRTFLRGQRRRCGKSGTHRRVARIANSIRLL